MWSPESLRALDQAASAGRVLHLGAGFERVLQEALEGRDVLRYGLPHIGEVDLEGDARRIPLDDETFDSYISSSVLEHVSDPDEAVAEMYRVLRPGGLVYAEIPFMRGFHLAPEDYQRYTYSGIERLFARHGFELVEKGISSGPITAWMLLLRDFATQILPWRKPAALASVVVGWAVHPFKYLDRYVNGTKWARHQACNFYYLGRRPG